MLDAILSVIIFFSKTIGIIIIINQFKTKIEFNMICVFKIK